MECPIIIDECIEPRYEQALSLRGYSVIRTRQGETDEDIIKWAEHIGAYILTHDKDFLDCGRAVVIPRKIPYLQVAAMVEVILKC